MTCNHDKSDRGNCKDCQPKERTLPLDVSLRIIVEGIDADCQEALKDEASKQIAEVLDYLLTGHDITSMSDHVGSMQISSVVEVHCE